jgi:hypothetical protein
MLFIGIEGFSASTPALDPHRLTLKETGKHPESVGIKSSITTSLARMFHELASRDREDGRATGQPQGVEPEAYLKVRRRARHPRTPGRTARSAVAAGYS